MRFLMIPLLYLLSVSSPVSARFLPSDTSRVSCYQHAEKRLMEAFRLMEKHYYKKNEVNWDSLMRAARQRLNASVDCEEALETVNWCFRLLSETHSFVMPAPKAAIYTNDPSLKSAPRLSQVVGEIKAELIGDDQIAYLAVPWMSTSDETIAALLADSLQREISRLDGTGIRKWIIDLRQNSGGNCWPMLAGLGPLLGEGVCGFFVSGSAKVPIRYENGAAYQGKYVRCAVTGKPYKMKADNKFIVVLTGGRTSSSGEIVALAFKGKAQTWLFGEPTAGNTTANASYPLSDKSLLVLTVCQEADRFGNLYSGPIVPDKLVSSKKTSNYDDVAKSEAIMWLQIQ
jgi:carboxyl-terminal processing protease